MNDNAQTPTTQNQQPSYVRRTFLVYKPIQIELFKVILWSNLITALFISLAGFGFIHTVTTVATDNHMSSLMVAINELKEFIWVYLVYLIVVFVLVMSFAFYAWIRISHSIAGPLYKIKMVLENYLKTGEFQTIVLRKDDKIKELAELINNSIQKK